MQLEESHAAQEVDRPLEHRHFTGVYIIANVAASRRSILCRVMHCMISFIALLALLVSGSKTLKEIMKE